MKIPGRAIAHGGVLAYDDETDLAGIGCLGFRGIEVVKTHGVWCIDDLGKDVSLGVQNLAGQGGIGGRQRFELVDARDTNGH